MIDNVSWIRGTHSFKAGIDAQFIGDDRVQRRAVPLHLPDHRRLPRGASRQRAARLHDAAAGLRRPRPPATTPASTASSSRTTGRSRRNLKVLYGLRYDLFDVPSARPFAANPYSQEFTIDKNNFGPRAGLSWSLDRSGAHGAARLDRPDVRAAAARLLRQRHPEQRRSARATPCRWPARAPARRHSRAASPTRPPGSCCRGRASPPSIPDFRTQSAWLTNVQIERAAQQRHRRSRSAT